MITKNKLACGAIGFIDHFINHDYSGNHTHSSIIWYCVALWDQMLSAYTFSLKTEVELIVNYKKVRYVLI